MYPNTYTDLWHVRIAGMLSIEHFDPFEHRLRCPNGPSRIILHAAAEGQTEDNHQAVADELVQEAAVLADDLVHRREITIEPAKHLRRRPAEAEGSKAADVSKHHRGNTFFAGQRKFVAPLPDGVGDGGIDVAGKEA